MFKIHNSFLNKGCGGVLTSQEGSFASPGYPQPYHHNAICTWEIKVSKGSRIQLVFIDVDLEAGYGCRFTFHYNTVECQNPYVRNLNNAKIRTKRSFDFRCSNFGHSGCSVRSIVQFELLCIGPNKNRLVWTISSDFRHKFLSKIQTKLFRFQTLFEIQTFYNRTIIDCPKSELVRISAFHCKYRLKRGIFNMTDLKMTTGHFEDDQPCYNTLH